MTEQAAQWWSAAPERQVSYLIGVDPGQLAVALEPVPDGAPAVIWFRPATAAPLRDLVSVLLDALDQAAIELFPSWLPGAGRLDTSDALGVPAVRALAAETAAGTRNFGPLLADLAERGLRARREPAGVHGTRSRLPAEVQAAGLVRVLTDAYARERAALIVEVPQGLTGDDERALVAGAEWLAEHGRLSVWLVGAQLLVVDRVHGVPVRLPEYLSRPVPTTPVPVQTRRKTSTASTTAELRYPPISGVPRFNSAVEQALERALTPHPWAVARRWNHTYAPIAHGEAYQLDLYFPTEGLVVELDGHEHRGRDKFAKDRRRDARLLMDGKQVVRFTNDEVLADVQLVVATIKQILRRHTATHPHQIETRQHVDR